MTDNDALFTAPPIVSPGTYPAIVTKVARVTLDTADGTKELVRWTFSVEADDEMVEMDALSSLAFSQRAKARKWATTLMGGDVLTVRPGDLEGKPCLVVVAEDDNGFAKVQDVVPAPKAKAK